MPAGRPSSYTEELGDRVCEAYSTVSGGLREAFSADPDLPDIATVYRWEQEYPEFRDRLDRARARRAHLMAQEAVDIADASDGDTLVKTNKAGEEFETPNHEWINRSRLRVETRKWLAQMLNQRAYGNKTEQTGSLEVRHVIHVGPAPK